MSSPNESMAIKARDQMIAQLQQKIDTLESALHSTTDDLEARTNLCELLQVQVRQIAEESSTKDTVIDALNVKTARLFEELDRANTDLRGAREELSNAHAQLEESAAELVRAGSDLELARQSSATTLTQAGGLGHYSLTIRSLFAHYWVRRCS